MRRREEQDMADLLQKEVDWSNGAITRRRSKTSRSENVPTVRYKLWPWTFQLLKEQSRSGSERVLLNRDGEPLRTDEVTTAGRYRKTDAVRLAIRRLAKKTGIPFSLKMLKKTSVSLLEDDSRYSGLRQLFLDHAPRSVAERHYVGTPQKLLDEAVLWLGKELGIAEPLARREAEPKGDAATASSAELHDHQLRRT